MSSKKKPSKVEVRDASQNEATKARVATVTAESALQAVGTAQASVGRTFASVGEKIQAQLQALDDVKKVVALTQADLETLHGKDSLLRSIEELAAARDEMSAQLERDREGAQREFEVEQANFSRQNEENAAVFAHQLAKDKLTAQTAFEAEIHAAKVAERDRRELIEKNFSLREEALKVRENELAALKAQVEAFPAQLKKEVEAAGSIAGNAVKRDLEHQISTLKMAAAADANMANLRVATLTEQNAQLQAQVNAANVRIEAANAKVAEIATKALDSASGQRTLTEMQNFAQKDSTNGASRKT